MRITAEQLEGLDACQDQLDVFNEEWPNGAEITVANCMRAMELGLDIGWATQNLLAEPAWKKYQEVTAPGMGTYAAVRFPSRKAYDEAEAAAWAAYAAARAPALKACEEATALAFYEALTQMKETAGAPY